MYCEIRITCDTVFSGRLLQIFWRNLHGFTSRKTVVFIATAIRTSDSISINIYCNKKPSDLSVQEIPGKETFAVYRFKAIPIFANIYVK